MEVNPSKPDSNKPFENFVHCKTYLVDGKLKNWSGKSSEVFSNIYTRNFDGQIKPTLWDQFLTWKPNQHSKL